MRNSLAVVLFAATSAAPALRAQEEPSKLELSGSYNYVRFNINAKVNGQPPSQTFNGNGGGGELMYNVNKWVGVLGDVGGYWATNAASQGAAIPYLFGPRVSFRHRVITPFAQVLLGGVLTSSGIVQTGWQSHFAMTAGGGIDVKVSKHFSIRPVQAEYFLTKKFQMDSTTVKIISGSALESCSGSADSVGLELRSAVGTWADISQPQSSSMEG